MISFLLVKNQFSAWPETPFAAVAFVAFMGGRCSAFFHATVQGRQLACESVHLRGSGFDLVTSVFDVLKNEMLIVLLPETGTSPVELLSVEGGQHSQNEVCQLSL